MLAIPVGCPPWSNNGQTIATQRLSALCQEATSRLAELLRRPWHAQSGICTVSASLI